jgi:peptidyl-prolyl cis-trans isomerase D
MLMQKIRDNAAWVVGIAVVCFGALIFVDWGMSPGNGLRHKNVVGSVAGEDISVEEFEGIVQDKAKEQTDQGRELNSETYAQIRRAVFTDIVRERLLAQAFQKYNLFGTPEQDLDYIRRNPPPGAEKAPIFMGPDSQFNQALYEKWLANPKTFDDRYMRMIEGIAATKTIPEQSMGRIMVAGNLPTALEAMFSARVERSLGWGLVVAASADSFPAPSASDADLRKQFDAMPDSFWIGKPLARMAAAVFPKTPSATDSLRVLQDADTAAARARRGEKFEDLVQQYSEDPGSAKNGGGLGGLRNRHGWVPAFSDAVAKLQKGQISDPVLSPFGYHVIKVRDIQIIDLAAPAVGKDTLYDVQHILITVTTSPETVDSLKKKLEDLRTAVKGGAKFEAAAAKVGAKIDSVYVTQGEIGVVKTTEVSPRGQAPLVPGASGWAFNGSKDQEASEVLETGRGIMTLSKPVIAEVGRNFELARPRLQSHLARVEGARKAKDYLTANLAKVQACDTSTACLRQIGKLSVTPLAARPANTWIEGMGFAPLGLIAAWGPASKAPKSWTAPVMDESGAVTLRLDSATPPPADEFAHWAHPGRGREGYTARAGIDEWLASRRREARIKNNLDQFFRD